MAAEPVAEYGDECLHMAIKLDKAIKDEAPAMWRGDQAKESVVLNTIHRALGKGREETLAVYEIVKNQPGY